MNPIYGLVRIGGMVMLTGRLLAEALANRPLVLEIDVPALGLAGSVLQCEGKDGVSLLDGVLAVGLAAGQGVVDGIKSGRRGELVWRANVLVNMTSFGIGACSAHTVLERHDDGCAGLSGLDNKGFKTGSKSIARKAVRK
jgi:hypothetical protein